MEIQEVTFEEFSGIFPNPYHVYGSGSFAGLNADKVEKVHCLAFRDGKYRLGLTGGVRDNVFFSPFSAPHGGFVFLKEDLRIQYIDDAVRSLEAWCREQGFEGIGITLPPSVYHPAFVAKQANSLHRNGFALQQIELNHSFDLNRFDGNYLSGIWHNARKNLNIALRNELTFHKCEKVSEMETAYQVIRANRHSRGFPLNMTLENVLKTIRLIPADAFLVFDRKNTPIASAIVFHVAKDLVQVIYWGDLPEYSALKTMNFLTYHVFEYYRNLRLKIVDIGQSTVLSVPNQGLCDFKESIGCGLSQKMTFRLELT